MLFFFASALYYNYFSMMRQWMAVAIVFWGFEWLKNKKWIQYFLCCILAAQFHPSAYICIIFSVMAVGKPWRRKQNFIIMSSVILLIFLNPILSKMEEAAEGTAYDYAIATMQTSSGSSPVRIVIAIVPVLLAFYCRKYIDSENDRAMEICVNMSVLNCLLNVIASFTSGLYVIRLATYLNPYNVILYSYLLKKVVRGRNQKVFLVGFYMFYFAFYCYQMTHQGAWGYSSDILGKFY